MVIAFHAFPTVLPNGFLGVDIFFVISGFLITSVIVEKLQNGTFSLVNFYIRRIKRIFPMALLVLLAVALLGSLTLFDAEFIRLKNHIFWASFFSLNYGLMHEAGYFDLDSVYKPLGHYWSLAVEEQFYIVWPLLAAFFFAIKQKFKMHRTILTVVLSVIFLDSLFYFFSGRGSVYYSTYARAWQLIAGATVAFLPKKVKISGWPSLVLFATAVLFVANFQLASVFAVIGAVVFIASDENTKFKKLFESRGAVLIGLMSYSLYLWHWPFISFLNIYFPPRPALPLLWLGLLLTFIFSFLSYYFIERPLRQQNWDIDLKQVASAKHLKSAACVTLLLGSFILLFNFSLDLPRLSATQEKIVKIKDTPKDEQPGCLLSSALQHKAAWCLTRTAANRTETGMVIGDSHAHSLYPGLIDQHTNVNWQLIADYSCPPFVLNLQRYPQ